MADFGYPCEHCGKKTPDPEKQENRNMQSGHSFNHEFGQAEHYWSGEFLCPHCEHWSWWGDSSL